MYNVIELKAICLWCGAANLQSGLECRKCGAPLTDQPEPPKVVYEPTEQPDEVSAFEAKAVFDSRWLKQVIAYEFDIHEQDVYLFEIPRAGVLAQLRIFFYNEEVDSAWRFTLETNGMIYLEDRPNRAGKSDVIRHVIDTDNIVNLRLKIKRISSHRSHPRMVELTRWLPTRVR